MNGLLKQHRLLKNLRRNHLQKKGGQRACYNLLSQRYLTNTTVKTRLEKPNILTTSKVYDPLLVEKDWYQYWEANGLFKPEYDEKGDIKKNGLFCIPAPPPNVTGALHIGHALTVALEDSLARFYRMKGKTVLFIPGFDHAGIATQSVVEKALWKQENKTRLDYTRDDFVEKLWEWKGQYHSKIKSQFKKLGGSYDWSKEAFTLDETRSKAVTEAFIRLFDEGIIYRDMKLVNWSTKLKTSISNLEVDTIDINGATAITVPEYDKLVKFGLLYYIEYAVEDSPNNEKIVVATSRPETIFGDVAIAVHPQDERYKHLHGLYVKHPFLDKHLPIILDSSCVTMEFGTGAVKITPAHDENDYKVGKKNKLPFINIFTEDGCLNENAGDQWRGMKRFDARSLVIEKLKEKNLFVKEEEYSTSIPLCSRSGDVIEPLLKSQWWVAQDEMAKDAIARVKNKEIEIQPTTAEADYFRWLENIKDWCISRQLSWGHRCPAYFVDIEGEECDMNQSSYWVAAFSIEEATVKATTKFPAKKFTLQQDEDVLDTWFSSGLWPLSTLGWPSNTKDLNQFYPFSLLESGWDILFFWITRMIFLNSKLTDIVPFKEVFCHPLVRDSEGRKMSKSLGNVIDPIDVIDGTSLESLQKKLQNGNFSKKEIDLMTKLQKKTYPKGIPRLGTDALRFTLCSYTSNNTSSDINLDIKKIQENKRFINKIYQATRFLLIHANNLSQNKNNTELSIMDKWIRSQLETTTCNINNYFEQRNFMAVTNELYQFWYLLCDNYIEYVKYILTQRRVEDKVGVITNLQYVVDNALRLLHPIMPFVSEELWQSLPNRTENDISISISSYPEFESLISFSNEKQIGNNFWSIVQNIRSVCEQYNIKEDGVVKINAKNLDLNQYLKSNENLVKHLLLQKIDNLEVVNEELNAKDNEWVNKYINPDVSISIYLKNQIGDAQTTITGYSKKIDKLSKKLNILKKTINSPSYQLNVSEKVKKSNEAKINDIKSEIGTYQETIETLQKIM
ncbi:hypothetical protein MOUN0_N09802 [Monosporozyma unispora]|nr:hypothetical protein C6P44_004830 [Kazachstania unispora]